MASPRSSTTLCLICGLEKHEVGKLHCFPSVLERSRLWQEKMNIVFTGHTLRHLRICSNYFTEDQYLNRINWRLRQDAVPTHQPANQIHKPEASTSMDEIHKETDAVHSEFQMMDAIQEIQLNTSRIKQQTEHRVAVEPLVEPSTSRALPSKNKKSVFRQIPNITQSPRTVKLISLVKSKESQIRKLKKLCRTRKNDIKSLTDLGDSKVVRNLFAGMPQTTSDFLISQLRCAQKSPRGRRSTVEEKAMALALYKRSPNGYNFLRKLVALPSKRTIIALLEKVPFEAGINEHIFYHISKCISTEKDRFVALLFDEIDIKENLQYDKKRGRFCSNL
ncbi:hypothetical protein ABEB36_014519 [Hypothenemus hampei]|uniref:THAP-type domain-containing protein n=1 Tax=Hypothenemus hampei TaxID=57062 RepID=A0ABD1E2A8_HYPHA